MTVYERLYASNQIEKFEEAIKVGDVKMLISILRSLQVDEESVKLIIKNNNLTE